MLDLHQGLMSYVFVPQVFAVEPQRMCGQMIQNYINHNGLANKVKVIAKKSDNITAEDLDHMKVGWRNIVLEG